MWERGDIVALLPLLVVAGYLIWKYRSASPPPDPEASRRILLFAPLNIVLWMVATFFLVLSLPLVVTGQPTALVTLVLSGSAFWMAVRRRRQLAAARQRLAAREQVIRSALDRSDP